MNEKEFEKYWHTNKQKLLNEHPAYRKAKDSYKMSSGADWLLYTIPVISGIMFMDYCTISHELLKWIASAAVTIICFVLCVWTKSLFSNNPSLSEIEKQVKKQLHDKLTKNE